MQFDGASVTHRHFLALCLSVLSVDARIHRYVGWEEIVKVLLENGAEANEVKMEDITDPTVLKLLMEATQ